MSELGHEQKTQIEHNRQTEYRGSALMGHVWTAPGWSGPSTASQAVITSTHLPKLHRPRIAYRARHQRRPHPPSRSSRNGRCWREAVCSVFHRSTLRCVPAVYVGDVPFKKFDETTKVEAQGQGRASTCWACRGRKRREPRPAWARERPRGKITRLRCENRSL